MPAVLKAYEDGARCVWLADSFQSVPRPDLENYRIDEGIRLDLAKDYLGVSQAEVAAYFDRYGLSDDRIRFLPRWFKETFCATPRSIAARYCGSTVTSTSRRSRHSTRCTRGCRPEASATSTTTTASMRAGRL